MAENIANFGKFSMGNGKTLSYFADSQVTDAKLLIEGPAAIVAFTATSKGKNADTVGIFRVLAHAYQSPTDKDEYRVSFKQGIFRTYLSRAKTAGLP